jgi:hypothetical protein
MSTSEASEGDDTRSTDIIIGGRTSKYVGVSWNRRARKWAAQSRVDQRTVYLGYFIDEEEVPHTCDRDLTLFSSPTPEAW